MLIWRESLSASTYHPPAKGGVPVPKPNKDFEQKPSGPLIDYTCFELTLYECIFDVPWYFI